MSVMYFASPGVPLDAPARFLLPFSSHSLPSLPPPASSLLSLSPPSAVYPLLSFPLPPPFVPASLLNLARRSGGAL